MIRSGTEEARKRPIPETSEIRKHLIYLMHPKSGKIRNTETGKSGADIDPRRRVQKISVRRVQAVSLRTARTGSRISLMQRAAVALRSIGWIFPAA